MSNFFAQSYFDKPFYSSKFFHLDYFTKNPFFNGIGGGTPTQPVPAVPVVVSSIIHANNDKRILVTWDQEMQAKGDIKQKIWIVIDGGAPVLPTAVIFSHDYMTLSFASEFKTGTTITWKYDDSDANIILESKAGIKADNQTYPTQNDLADEPGDEPCIPCEPCDVPKKKKKK